MKHQPLTATRLYEIHQRDSLSLTSTEYRKSADRIYAHVQARQGYVLIQYGDERDPNLQP